MKRQWVASGVLGLTVMLGAVFVGPGISMASPSNPKIVNLTTYLDDVTATADMEQSPFFAENAIDGKARTRWDAGVLGVMVDPAVLTVDLGDIYEISKIQLIGGTAGKRKISYFEISVSTDLKNWDVMQTVRGNHRAYSSNTGLNFIEAQYIRYEVFGGTNTARLGEMKIMGPQPPKQVPIPATALLFGSGFAGLVGLLRRSSARVLTGVC